MDLGEACARLRDGRIEMRDFEESTRADRKRIARHLVKKWRQPNWADVEDVEVDLLVAMWRFAFEFDANRSNGGNLERFVIYNACDKAKKAIHKRRGASLSGNADANPSNIDRPFSALPGAPGTASEDTPLEQLVPALQCRPSQEDDLEEKERTERAKGACRSVPELLSVQALAEEGSLDGAATRLYEDSTARTLCRFRTRDRALKVVARSAIDVAMRLCGDAA